MQTTVSRDKQDILRLVMAVLLENKEMNLFFPCHFFDHHIPLFVTFWGCIDIFEPLPFSSRPLFYYLLTFLADQTDIS